MLYIRKDSEPEWLKKFRKTHPSAEYSSKAFDEYKAALKSQLLKEQKYLCAYCCGRIDMKHSHNEHIEPQNPGRYTSRRSLDYTNIVASCMGFKGGKTCGKHKENDYNPAQFISPLQADCEDFFKYYPDGTMNGDDYTIELLNLNFYELKNARRAVYRQLQNMDRETIEEVFLQESSDMKEPFTNVIKWYAKYHN